VRRNNRDEPEARPLFVGFRVLLPLAGRVPAGLYSDASPFLIMPAYR
jgi:hypothetical protein